MRERLLVCVTMRACVCVCVCVRACVCVCSVRACACVCVSVLCVGVCGWVGAGEGWVLSRCYISLCFGLTAAGAAAVVHVLFGYQRDTCFVPLLHLHTLHCAVHLRLTVLYMLHLRTRHALNTCYIVHHLMG